MKNSTLKFCAVLLAICTSTIHLQAMDEWDGNAVAQGFYSGTGTEADPYRIFTASQFLYFIQQTRDGNTFNGQYIELCNDISFRTNEGLKDGGDFYGDFDGNDHKIQVNEYDKEIDGYVWCGWHLFNLYGSMHDVLFVRANEVTTIYTGGILYNCKFEFPGGAYHREWTVRLEGGTIANCVSDYAYSSQNLESKPAQGFVGYYNHYNSSSVKPHGYCLNCYFPIVSKQYNGYVVCENYYGVIENCGEEAGNDWLQSHTEYAYKTWPLTFNPTYPEYLIQEQPQTYNPSVVCPNSDEALYQWCYQEKMPMTFEDITFSSSTQTKNIVVPYDNMVLSFDFEADGYETSSYNGDNIYAWISINGEKIVNTYDDKAATYSCQLSAGTCEISCVRSDITNIRLTYPAEFLTNETSSVLSKQTIMERPGIYFCQVSYGEGCDVMNSDYVDYEKLLTIDNVTYVINEDATATVLWIADMAVDITIPETVYYDDVNYPVTSISSKAFVDCTSLVSIKCKTSAAPALLGGTTFEGLIPSNTTLYVPKTSVSAYQTAAGWKDFTNIQPISISATSLTLDVTEASLASGETLTLNATLLPADVTETTLSWTSNNEAVATVDANGVVTAVADGEATITVSTMDGSNLSATCVVTVETEDVGGEVVDSENMIYFEDATAFVNTTINLPLLLKNEADITAVQFDVYLPEGVVIEKNSRGKYNITFNEERTDNSYHTLSAALQEDGAVRVICYSTDSEVFLGNEGAIFNFPLEVPEMEEGDYSINIKNIILTEQSGKKHEIALMTSTLNVLAVALGDCNRDNAVDVADIVTLANHILNNPVDIFVEKAADFNNDNAVDVADIVAIANYILNGNTTAVRALTREVLLGRAASAGYSFDILPFVLEAEGSKTISLDLVDATESFTAFQCDLYLPEGISIDKNNRGKYNLSFNEERTDNSFHTLSAALQEDGAVRLVCYSTDSEVFMGTDGALVNIPLSADASLQSGVYEFSISNQVLTYQDGTKVVPETYKGSIIVGDGGEIEDVKLYGRYTAEALSSFSEALSTNNKITSVDLTDAVSVAESGELTTGNPNTLVYLAEGAALANESNVVYGDECANLLLTDGYTFSLSAVEAAQAGYVRTLNGTLWNALYMPFDIPVSAFGEAYDVACISKVEESEDGSLVMLIETITEGSLEPNTPYFVRAKSEADKELTIQVEGTTSCVAEENTVSYAAGATTLQVIGNYSTMTSAELSGCYAISTQGMWQPAAETAVLRPFRTYLKMTGAPARAIRIHAVGEATDIESDAAMSTPDNSALIYDLQGRRVEKPTKGMYIVNGKKVLY